MQRNIDLSSKKNSAQEYHADNLENVSVSDVSYIKILNLVFHIICPVCNAEMKIRDTKRRYIKFGNGERYPFNLRRYYCPTCYKLHTEIPDIVKPYKQYDIITIEKVASGDSADFCGDDSTIRKWRGKK